MKNSIGSPTSDQLADGDRDGVPDRSEEEFALDGQSAVPPAPREASHPEPQDKPDDGGLESSRRLQTDVLPPAAN